MMIFVFEIYLKFNFFFRFFTTYKGKNFYEWRVKINGIYVAGLIVIDGND